MEPLGFIILVAAILVAMVVECGGTHRCGGCLHAIVLLLLLSGCTDTSTIEPPEPPHPPVPLDSVTFIEDYSGTLPVLFIDTDNFAPIVSKEKYVHANWWLDPMGIDGVDSLGSSTHPLGMLIRGRGNSIWTEVDKKSYRLKFDEKHKILGMHSSRHWALQAQALYWMGEMNDALPFEIGRRMGMSWNPHMEPVEVVLNREYIGLYFLTENVRVAKHRVNVEEQEDYETDAERITGGWLLEIDNYPETSTISMVEGNGEPFWITSHSPELLSHGQRGYISTIFRIVDRAIYDKDKESRLWEDFVDIDSLAIYYIVQEVMDNPEAFSGSCYIHKQRGEDTKLIFGPLWDFGSSYYRWSRTYAFNEFIYENIPSYCRSRWISEIVKFPHFQERVRYHWKRFYEEVYPEMDDYMDRFVAKIDAAGNADHVRWPQYPSNNLTKRLNEYGKPSFHKKVEWLNSQWGTGL